MFILGVTMAWGAVAGFFVILLASVAQDVPELLQDFLGADIEEQLLIVAFVGMWLGTMGQILGGDKE
jgi:hypothetical protein